ncbi:MAG: quinone-dependent dihydroorotate dehydrogenase [Flavobacteriales bacterium]
MYKQLIRPIFFLFRPESAHHLSITLVKIAFAIPLIKTLVQRFYSISSPLLQVKKAGITFPNPVGLAAGFDKNAELINDFDAFGFGFIEVGTVTPMPQDGNAKPRMFRLKPDQALINRMGFNNHGVDAMVNRLKHRKTKITIGGNIGKNKVTANEQAHLDYLHCFDRLHPYVDYFVVNVSSPNTPGLRALQDKEPLTQLLKAIQSENQKLDKPKPILLKIAPDLSTEQINEIAEIVSECELNGVVATNTTIDRSRLKSSAELVNEQGGLSGKPLKHKSTEVISLLRKSLGDEKIIIGVGGVFTADDALEKIKAGADVVQVYTGFIYEGPAMVKNINKAYLQWKQSNT